MDIDIEQNSLSLTLKLDINFKQLINLVLMLLPIFHQIIPISIYPLYIYFYEVSIRLKQSS